MAESEEVMCFGKYSLGLGLGALVFRVTADDDGCFDGMGAVFLAGGVKTWFLIGVPGFEACLFCWFGVCRQLLFLLLL